MSGHQTIQYQAHTEPIFFGAEEVTESRWHQPWSEPVRFKIAPVLAIALMASGLFMTPTQEGETISPDKWFAPLSEPVRIKVGLRADLQQFFAGDTVAIPSAAYPSWFTPLSEPVRLKPGLRADLQQFYPSFVIQPPPASTLLQGYNWLSEPVRILAGLREYLQQTVAMPPRHLPNPDVTATLAATETNLDVFLGAVNVYDSAGSAASNQGARVSIVEVQVPGNDGISIRES